MGHGERHKSRSTYPIEICLDERVGQALPVRKGFVEAMKIVCMVHFHDA